IELTSEPRRDMRSGSLIGVVLTCGKERYEVVRRAEGVAELHSPYLDPQQARLWVPHLPALVADELGIYERDESFEAAVAQLAIWPRGRDAPGRRDTRCRRADARRGTRRRRRGRSLWRAPAAAPRRDAALHGRGRPLRLALPRLAAARRARAAVHDGPRALRAVRAHYA